MNGPLIVPTVWGNHVRVRQAYDADGTISGAGIDFLESDGRSILDRATLTRLDALKAGMALCEFAHEGLSGEEAMEMLAQGMKALMGPLEPVAAAANVFPFRASSRSAPVPGVAPASQPEMSAPLACDGPWETPAL